MRQNDYDTLNYDPLMYDEPTIIQDGKPVNIPARPPGFTYYPKRGISQAPTATMRSATTSVTKISRNRKKFAYLVLPNSHEIIIPFPPGLQFWPTSKKTTPTSHVTFDIDEDANPTNRGRISRDEKKFTTPGGAASAAETTQQPNREQQVAQSEAPFMTAPPPSRPISAPRANDANEGEKMITNLVTTEPTHNQLTITLSASAPTALQLPVAMENFNAPAGKTEGNSEGPVVTAAINEIEDFTTAPNDNEKFKFTVAVPATQGYVFNDEPYTGSINFASSATRKAAVTSKDAEMLKAFGGLGSLINQFIPGDRGG
jgi:hypothetical protein